MTKKSTKKPVAQAVGAAVAGTMLLAGAATAADNPFGMTELGSGYMQVAMEGKCGGSMAEKSEKMADGKGGGKMAEKSEKMADGKCGGKMADTATKKMKGGKCGTGKCGGNKKRK